MILGPCDKSYASNQGVYIPQDTVMDRFLFFVVDFAEDTPDEKRTLHGTARAMYQRLTVTHV